MNTFIHTSDDKIFINNNEFPLSTFQTFEPAYALNSTYEERTYIQGFHHRVLDNDTGTYVDLGTTWTEGDSYISNLGTYLSASVTETLQSLIDRYDYVITSEGYTDISDPNFLDEYRQEILEGVFALNDFEKITFANRYPEFTSLSVSHSEPAVNTVLSRVLLSSDWTQLGDANLSAADQALWDNYRSSVRALYGVGYTSILDFSMPIAPLNYKKRI